MSTERSSCDMVHPMFLPGDHAPIQQVTSNDAETENAHFTNFKNSRNFFFQRIEKNQSIGLKFVKLRGVMNSTMIFHSEAPYASLSAGWDVISKETMQWPIVIVNLCQMKWPVFKHNTSFRLCFNRTAFIQYCLLQLHFVYKHNQL